MKSLYQAVYAFYKKAYPSGVVLFRVGTQVEAYAEDAQIVSGITGIQLHVSRDLVLCRFQYSMLAEWLDVLVQAGMKVHIVEYRNPNGIFVLPEVKQILSDYEDDY